MHQLGDKWFAKCKNNLNVAILLCLFLTIYFTYNSVNTVLFLVACFDSTESCSGYDWNHMCSQGTRAHFGIPKRRTDVGNIPAKIGAQ